MDSRITKLKCPSQACLACKRRKVKCVGNPCAYCIKKNYVCEFNIPKKRGPQKKKLPGVQECGSLSVVLLNRIQLAMDKAYRQTNFVDFYFQYIGKAIPKEFKAPLLVPLSEDLSSDIITQLYVISASVMKFFGYTEQESNCIEKAQEYATNIFNCDTVESALSLMMMALYVGHKHHKYKSFMHLASQIADVPTLKGSFGALKVKYACETMINFIDESLTTKQKYEFFINKICAISDAYPDHVNPAHGVLMTSVKIKHLLLVHGNYDDDSIDSFLHTLTSSAVLVDAETRATMMNELAKMNEFLAKADTNDSSYIYSTFIAAYTHFVIEWRSATTEEAIAAALNTATIYKQNKEILGLWHHPGFRGILSLPYFLHITGYLDKAVELLNDFEETTTNTLAKEELREGWKRLTELIYTQNLLPTFLPHTLPFSQPELSIVEQNVSHSSFNSQICIQQIPEQTTPPLPFNFDGEILDFNDPPPILFDDDALLVFPI